MQNAVRKPATNGRISSDAPLEDWPFFSNGKRADIVALFREQTPPITSRATLESALLRWMSNGNYRETTSDNTIRVMYVGGHTIDTMMGNVLGMKGKPPQFQRALSMLGSFVGFLQAGQPPRPEPVPIGGGALSGQSLT